MTQDELVTLINKKDEQAFDYLYDMYAQSLFGVIENIIKNKAQSEDVLQEVMVKIWRNLPQYDPEKGRFFTWIVNIARNSAIDKYRSKAYKKERQNLDANNFVHSIETHASLNNQVNSIGIEKFIKKLKPACIKIIDLLFFKGFTHKEASENLKIPLGTLKTRNRACIHELRNLLQVK